LRLTLQTRRSRLYRAASHAALGEHVLATEVVAEAIANAPGLTTEFVEIQETYRDRDVKRKLIDLLVASGLPRRPGSVAADSSKSQAVAQAL